MERSAKQIDVLHVDDNLEFADLASTFVERYDDRLSVEVETSVQAAVSSLHNVTYDCIVSDYEMPQQNGIEFLEAVRELYPNIPFILFTGKGSEAIASEAISAGVSDYLQKGSGTSQYDVLANRIINTVAQKRARQKVATTEQRLETIADNTTEILWLFTADWDTLLFVNSSYEELWGHSIEALREDPQSFLENVHPGDQDVVTQAMAQLSAGNTVDIECRVVADEDTTRWMWIKGQPVFDENNDVTKIVGYSRDITERKSLESDLERHKKVVALSGDPMYMLDADGYFEYVNTALCDVTGYTKEALIGTHVEKIVPEQGIESGEELIRSLLATEEQKGTFEMDGVIKTGDTIPLENHVSLLTSNDELQGTVGVLRDITERKEREQKLTTLHDVANKLTTSTSREQICEHVIDASEQILDFEQCVIALEDGGVLSPVAVSQAVSPEELSEFEVGEGIAGKTYKNNEPIIIDDMTTRDNVTPKNEYRSVLSLPIGEHGNFQAVSRSVGAFDETDLEIAELLISHAESALSRLTREQRLQRRNQSLEDFTDVVAHDLRNPLNVAQGHLELAKQTHENEHLETATEALDRGFDLIKQLLTLARTEREEIETKPVALGRVAQKSWDMVKHGTAEFSVTTTAIMSANEGQLCRLFENLFRNAVEHSSGDIHIEVGTLSDGFYVVDTGPGIPASKQNQIFERGFTESSNGAGFGLSIVSHIVAAHGWDIEVMTGDAGGTRFEITGVDFVES